MPIDRNSAQYITGAIYKPTQTSAPGVWDLDDQANNIAKNLWPLPPQAVQRSLRFNSADSTNLTRTFTATGDQTRWTWSGWVKRAAFGVTQGLMWRNNPGATPHGGIRFEGTNVITVGTDRGGTNYWFFGTTAVFRDPSAWYHIVVVLNTSETVQGNRCKIYVNGVQQTTTITSGNSTPSLNDTMGGFNSNVQHNIGALDSTANSKFDGYIAEMHFVDGQVLDPTSFGETDQQTGVWIPKRYTGTYGTNGFRLSFANNSSTAALGYDSSGNGNNWTANNFSVTPGVGNDSLLDVPSLYGTDTGLGGEILGNYCTWNPLNATGASTANGNLEATLTGNASLNAQIRGTIAPISGKWYWENIIIVDGNQSHWVGVIAASARADIRLDNSNALSQVIYARYDGQKVVNGTMSAYAASYTTGDIIGVALDLDLSVVTFYKNNVSQGTLSLPTSGIAYVPVFWYSTANTGSSGTVAANFGQRPFTYPAPSGFKALCTTNLPAPAIGQTSSNQADNHFAVVTYTGNGTAQTITGVGFQPDLVWTKLRNESPSSTWHRLIDSVRGGDRRLSSNDTQTETQNAGLITSFNADGFSVGNDNGVNASGINIVAWCWNAGGVSITNNAGTNGATIASTYRANRAAGFSIVSWTGNGSSNQTIAHGLAVTPAFLIVKRRDGVTGAWRVWHKSLSGATYYLGLEQQTTQATSSTVFNGQSSTTFTVGNDPSVNNTGTTYIAYCWAEVPGYSAFGSYTGNGSADGPFIYTGFRPKWVLVKSTSAAGDWALLDTTRDIYNLSQTVLYPNAAYAEDTANVKLDIVSNGFKFRSTIGNGSGTSYVYMAFAETPARLSTAR